MNLATVLNKLKNLTPLISQKYMSEHETESVVSTPLVLHLLLLVMV